MGDMQFYVHGINEEKLYRLTPREVVCQAAAAEPSLEASETKDGGFVLSWAGKELLSVCEFWRPDGSASKITLRDPSPMTLEERLRRVLNGEDAGTKTLTFETADPVVKRVTTALSPHEIPAPEP
jgi:hypothetical protein